MKRRALFKVLLAWTLASSAISPLQAGWFSGEEALVDSSETATLTLEEHYALGASAIEACDWPEAARQFAIIAGNFPETSCGREAHYYLGVSEYYLEEYDAANTQLGLYLKRNSNPLYFQEAMAYKLAIADKLAFGAKKRFFGYKKLPKWSCGKNLALNLFEEVIAAIPCHKLALEALVSKGYLLWQLGDYRGAVDALQLAIRRFPKQELAPDCYVYISYIYLEQACQEYQNPDLLALAEINLEKFLRDFPREERLCQVQDNLLALKELYAFGLYRTGSFYERTNKCRAAIIYYRSAMHQFPETTVASLCQKRLSCLDAGYDPLSGAPIIDEQVAESLSGRDESEDELWPYSKDEDLQGEASFSGI